MTIFGQCYNLLNNNEIYKIYKIHKIYLFVICLPVNVASSLKSLVTFNFFVTDKLQQKIQTNTTDYCLVHVPLNMLKENRSLVVGCCSFLIIS